MVESQGQPRPADTGVCRVPIDPPKCVGSWRSDLPRTKKWSGLVRRVRVRIRTLPPAVVLAIIVAVALVPAIAFALAPDPPINLQLQPGTESPVIAQLAWDPPAGGGVAAYRVEVSTIGNGTYRLVDEVTDTDYVFTDGYGGVDYYFRVKAVNSADEDVDACARRSGAAEWANSPHVTAEVQSQSCAKCHAVHEAEPSQPVLIEAVRRHLARISPPYATSATLAAASVRRISPAARWTRSLWKAATASRATSSDDLTGTCSELPWRAHGCGRFADAASGERTHGA